MFIFEDSLKSGQAGETYFINHFEGLISLDGRNGDILLEETGEKIELKSEYYCENKTPNFAIELLSVVEQNKPGGPWQARDKDCALYVHYFVKSGTYYSFYTEQLLNWLNSEDLDFYRKVDIPNKGYTTKVILIPRNALSHLYTKGTVNGNN